MGAKDDLVTIVNGLRREDVCDIYPEELGFLALNGSEDEKMDLATSLRYAEMFTVDYRSGNSTQSKSVSSEDQQLNVRLAFFSRETKVSGLPHFGEFAYVNYVDVRDAKESVSDQEGQNYMSFLAERSV